LQDIRLDKEFQSLIPPLSSEEYKQLEANVISDGCRDSLVTWQGTLIDGHNRYKICTEHNIPFQTADKQFDSRNEVIQWIILNQFGRRNLLPFQRSELALRLKPIIEAKAKERMLAGKKIDPVQKSSQGEETKTRTELAKLAGVSHDTIKRVAIIQKEATPEQLQRAKEGGKGNSVNAIYQEIKQLEQPSATTKICHECGKELPRSEFYDGKGVCKDCFNHHHSIKDIKGNTITSSSEANRLAAKYSADIERDLYDTEKEVEYTVDDLLDEMNSLTDYFSRNAKNCLTIHSTLLSIQENKQKIIAVLSEAETAIQKLKGLLI